MFKQFGWHAQTEVGLLNYAINNAVNAKSEEMLLGKPNFVDHATTKRRTKLLLRIVNFVLNIHHAQQVLRNAYTRAHEVPHCRHWVLQLFELGQDFAKN